MTVDILGSSSSGNCYLLKENGQVLMIECGINFKEVLPKIDYDPSVIKACIVSHQHNDHAKYLKDVVSRGIHTLALECVYNAKEIAIEGTLAHTIKNNVAYRFGMFTIIPFAVSHDVPCVGYVITTPANKIVFATDTGFVDRSLVDSICKDFDTIFIECNYDVNTLNWAIDNGYTEEHQVSRLLNYHLSLGGCIQFFADGDNSNIQHIILCHPSKFNADKNEMIKSVTEEVGCIVDMAEKGISLTI